MMDAETLYNMLLEDINDIYGGGMIEKVKPWLEIGPNGYFKDIWGLIESGCQVFVVIGVILSLIYLVGNLTDKTLSQGTSMETFYKCIIEFCLSLVLITNAFDIVVSASELGTGVINDIETIVESTDANQASSAELTAELDKIYSGKGISRMINLIVFDVSKIFLPATLARIGEVLVVVACMSRGINIILYGMFAPIPLADVYKDGLNSKGIRYLKKLVALFMQGAMILMVVVGSQALRGSLSKATDGLGASTLGIFYNLGIILVTVMLVFKSQSVANDVLGV